MSWTYSEDYYRQYTKDSWNESAAGYDPIRRNLDAANPALLAAARAQKGQRVLDVATGPGEPALTLAKLVAPGQVVGVDLSERMVELARANAKSQGVANAAFEVQDAEALTLPDASFDLAACRFGLQIVTDPDRALAQMHRVLKPGGRMVATVWSVADKVPSLHVIMGPMLEHAEPDENGYLPTPYEMGEPDALAAMARKAGFHAVREERHTVEQRFRSVDEFMAGCLQGTPLGHSLREEDPPVQEAILRKTHENLKRWTRADGTVSMPAEFVLVSGTR